MDSRRIGVLGGGQLGRMFLEAANRLNIQVNILDAQNAPAKQISNHASHVEGSFKDAEKIRQLADTCDIITVEIEHVDTHVLEEVSGKVKVHPDWQTIRTIQDKYEQKNFLSKHDVPTAPSVAVDVKTEDGLKEIGRQMGYPFMLKSRTEAYDGKGNYPVKSEDDVPAAIEALGKLPLYAERWANFKAELAVMVVKTKDGVLAYPTVETIHEDSICKLVYAPARHVSRQIAAKAQAMAKKAINAFKGKGVYGVEMFLLEDDTLLVNEIAPRPHNSGHYTIEACPVSQYEAHLSALLDIPLTQRCLRLKEPAIMLNLLGGASKDSHILAAKRAKQLVPDCSIHLYGKGDARPGRKMGHITLTAPSMHAAELEITPLVTLVDTLKHSSTIPETIPTDSSLIKSSPPIAWIMGSDSDLPTLVPGFRVLDALSLPYEVRITSAHRTPHLMAEYCTTAASRGIQVIIAAAGGAAHLPGMAAAHTSLPVIGIPIKASTFDGQDSLLSIVQMPRGVPVATVAVGNSVNAALLAVRILGAGDEGVREKVEGYAERAEEEVLGKDERLREVGWEEYLGGK